jgi:hypothetical protein
VLHHLAGPDVGLRALRSVLKPEGAIYLMVYAPYGRTGVYMLQDYCRRLGIATSDQDIQDLIATLKELPQHHPLVPLLQGSSATVWLSVAGIGRRRTCRSAARLRRHRTRSD